MQYHTRVPNRLQGYDYSQNGAYFITFCTQGRGRRGAHCSAPTVSNIVQQLKSCVTKHLHHPIWQKSFHDHVIRTQTDYETIWLYIDSNPQTWQTDCLNPNRNNPQQSDTRKDVTL